MLFKEIAVYPEDDMKSIKYNPLVNCKTTEC
jgi:hypothetical protein